MIALSIVISLTLTLNFLFIIICTTRLGLSTELDLFYLFISISLFWQTLITNACNQIYYISLKKQESWWKNSLSIVRRNLPYFSIFAIATFYLSEIIFDNETNPFNLFDEKWKTFVFICITGILITFTQSLNSLHMKNNTLITFEIKNMIATVPGVLFILIAEDLNLQNAVLAFYTRIILVHILSIPDWHRVVQSESTETQTHSGQFITFASQSITKSDTVIDRSILTHLPPGSLSLYGLAMQVVAAISVILTKILVLNKYESIRIHGDKLAITQTSQLANFAIVVVMLFIGSVIGTFCIIQIGIEFSHAKISIILFFLGLIIFTSIASQYYIARITFNEGPNFIYRMSFITFLFYQPIKYFVAVELGLVAFAVIVAAHHLTDLLILKHRTEVLGEAHGSYE